MKRPRAPAWTEAETAELIRLHSLLYSAREMAALLGKVSKNSVLGKLNRLGLCLALSPAEAARCSRWDKEKVAELRKLKRAGRTVAEIAERLGTSSPAVRSKIRAIGEVPARRAPYSRAPPKRFEPIVVAEPAHRPPGAPVPFLEAQRGHCRFPMWDGRPPLSERMVCGADTEAGWSYCPRHHAACHNVPRRPGL